MWTQLYTCMGQRKNGSGTYDIKSSVRNLHSVLKQHHLQREGCLSIAVKKRPSLATNRTSWYVYRNLTRLSPDGEFFTQKSRKRQEGRSIETCAYTSDLRLQQSRSSVPLWPVFSVLWVPFPQLPYQCLTGCRATSILTPHLSFVRWDGRERSRQGSENLLAFQ